ncbi:serine/threonine-protein kinase [Nannocystis punicea]|uniref:Serine/threonine-protein kinase n=1 Tax=Nannocystis punicea TaxID=2995304 RepID=A0ABY7H885_9BACT|nr:serine/threonine-protein kinase [Nannocystis poenicansa]WAS95471.1 serine/threonine-protein kinase [Nannocystis poenicansa]
MFPPLPTEDIASTLPQLARTRPLDAEAMRRRIGARLFGEDTAPMQLGRFRILRSLGVGGMGVVYAAEDDTLGRVVALKMIRDDVLVSDADRRRLLHEARALARLSHPNVVQLHEVVTAGEAVCLVMEYVAGTTLSQWLRTEPRDVAAIVDVFVAAARGLAAAHRAGIVHRDVKPGNILVGDDGRVRIVDFGLARGAAAVDSPTIAELSGSTTDPGARATDTGTVAGTPAYMAPEAFSTGRVDASSDQFSFCVALHECLYGDRPFGPRSVPGRELAYRAIELPAGAGQRRIPRALRRLLARGLAVRPADRFTSMDVLLGALEKQSFRLVRSLLLPLVLLLTGGLIAAAIIPFDAFSPGLCPEPRDQLEGIWDFQTKAAVRTAILATAQPFSLQTADFVQSRLDAYVEEWLDAHVQVCEEIQGRNEQALLLFERSELCLAHRRSALDALIEQLRHADAALVASVPELVHRLPDIRVCRDREALLDGSYKRPRDPRLAPAEAALAHATSLHAARLGVEALAQVDAALAAIRAVGDPLLEADALRLRGVLLGHHLGDVRGGLQHLHAAGVLATGSALDGLAWRVWNDLAVFAARVEQDGERARQYLEYARAAATRHARLTPNDRADLLDTDGHILFLEDQNLEALSRHREAYELRRDFLDARHPELIWAGLRLANATANAGEPELAMKLFDELKRDALEIFGREHPAVVRVELAEAQLLAELDQTGPARSCFADARPILLRTYGPDTILLARVELELAHIDFAERQFALATARARTVLGYPESSVPAQHQLRVEALALLSDIFLEAHQPSTSVEVYRALLTWHDDGRVELDLEALLYSLGAALCELQRCGEGFGYFSRLNALYTNNPPEHPEHRAFVLYGLASYHLENRQPEIALPHLEEARRLTETDDADRYVRMDVARLLSRCLTALKREPQRARRLQLEADALARRSSTAASLDALSRDGPAAAASGVAPAPPAPRSP